MQHFARTTGTIAGLATALLALSVLIGWMVGSRSLVQVLPGAAPMQYNTAFCFAVLGVGLAWPKGRRRSAAATGAGFLVVTVAGLSLVQYTLGLSFGIDDLLFHPYVTDATSHPGRMAPNTALAFFAAAVGVVILGAGAFARARPGIATAVAGSIVIGMDITTLVGYASGVETAYSWGRFTQMAVHTAAAFLIVGLGLIAHGWASGVSNRQSIPSWLPIPILVTGAVTSVALAQAIGVEARSRIGQVEDAQAGAAAVYVREQLERHIDELERMADRWAYRGGTPFEEWRRDAEAYVNDSRLYQAVEWVDPEYHVRWVVPLDGNERALDLDLGAEPRRRRALDTSRDRGTPAVSRVVQLEQGPDGFLITVPLTTGSDFGGFLIGVMRLEPLLEDLRAALEVDGYSVAMVDGLGRVAAGQPEPPADVPEAETAERYLGAYGLPWRFRVWASARSTERRYQALPALVLGSGLGTTLLLGFAAFSLTIAQRQRYASEVANRQLQREVKSRVRAEKQLEAKAKELEESNSELEQFAYVASHDLKEPLRMVAGYTQLLADRYSGQLDEEADVFIGYAVDGATRMQRLIADLLDYSRVGSGQRAAEPVDCSRVLAQVEHDLAGAVNEAEAELAIAPLPVVTGDASQIGRVFQNLVANAVKFRSPDRPPRVSVSARREGDEVRFEVRDNGIGFETEHADQVFQIFRRLHRRGAYAGTGIGLAICKKIVEGHGGRIWCESSPGAGATFYFTLPASPVAGNANG